jgi:hypothetical protein
MPSFLTGPLVENAFAPATKYFTAAS